MGVMNIEMYNSCRMCKAKVMAVNDMMGESSKCAMKVKMNRCGKSKVARFMIEDSQQKVYEVSAFQDIIEVIIEDTDGT